MQKIRFSLAIATCLIAGSAVGADFDGSKRLICAPADTFKCDAGGACARGEASDVNLDRFIEIDVQNKSATGVASGRTSPIGHVGHDGGQLVLHGAQNARGWSATISESTGEMTIVAAAEKLSFTVFGACMAAE